MQPYNLRLEVVVKMAVYRVANIRAKLLNVVALCKYRLAKRASIITTLDSILDQKNDLIHNASILYQFAFQALKFLDRRHQHICLKLPLFGIDRVALRV